MFGRWKRKNQKNHKNLVEFDFSSIDIPTWHPRIRLRLRTRSSASLLGCICVLCCVFFLKSLLLLWFLKQTDAMNVNNLFLCLILGFVAASEDERLPNKCEGRKEWNVSSCTFSPRNLKSECFFIVDIMILINIYIRQCVSFWQSSCRMLWRRPAAPKKF